MAARAHRLQVIAIPCFIASSVTSGLAAMAVMNIALVTTVP